MIRGILSVTLAVVVPAAMLASHTAMAELKPSKVTQVITLGTGTPLADPDRSGPATAIVVNGVAYLVDFGPGVVRRASAMSPRYGGSIDALTARNIRHAFLTHLHSDHTSGLPDLIFTPWTLDRDQPLELYGPEGTTEMADQILEAYREDIRYRVYGLEPTNNQGWRVNAHTIDEGVVFKDENVTVEAFKVVHGNWPNAFGYRFTTPDRVIVVSGDATLDANIEKYSKDVDILVHEVYAVEGLNKRVPKWQKYHSSNHTSAHQLGELASRVKPKLLVMSHILFFGSTPEQVLKEVKEKYAGDVVLANDLDVF